MLKNDFFTLIIVFVLLIAGGIFLYGKNFQYYIKTNGKIPITPTLSSNAKTESITIIGSNFRFNPNLIHVTKGDVIKLSFINTDGLHNLTIPNMHISTRTIHTGQENTISFIASKSGSYRFYDSYAHHREFGMDGILIVQ